MDATTFNSRLSLRRPAWLLLAGQLLYILITQLHAGGDANDHHAIFDEYAHDQIWTVVHLGQFAAMAILLGGFLTLLSALADWAGGAGRLGAAAAVSTLALYGVLQAVDGIALKQAVNAWAGAPDAEKAARFATAEGVRWLEWGLRSYEDSAMSLTLLLVTAVLAQVAWLPRTLACLVGLSSLAYLGQGWVAGAEGFSPAQSAAIVLGWVLSLIWMVWLVVMARRARERGSVRGAIGDPARG